jgi:nitroreductase
MEMNETLKIIKQRRSIRNFKEQQIKDEDLHKILEAGSYAPYAWDQSWHFTVVQNREMLDRLNNAAKEAARQMDDDYFKKLGNNKQYDCLYGALTLIIVSGDKQAGIQLDADCAAATQNMLLAAESLGLGSCWILWVLMAFHSSEAAQLLKDLKIPEAYRPYDSAVFGYRKGAVVTAEERKTNLVTFIR